MTVIHTLVKSGHIKLGSWLGVQQGNHISNLVLHQVLDQGDLILNDPRDQSCYKVKPELICEVEGMKLHRFLAQADLNMDGTPIQNLTRRGRKRKIRP